MVRACCGAAPPTPTSVLGLGRWSPKPRTLQESPALPKDEGSHFQARTQLAVTSRNPEAEHVGAQFTHSGLGPDCSGRKKSTMIPSLMHDGRPSDRGPPAVWPPLIVRCPLLFGGLPLTAEPPFLGLLSIAKTCPRPGPWHSQFFHWVPDCGPL